MRNPTVSGQAARGGDTVSLPDFRNQSGLRPLPPGARYWPALLFVSVWLAWPQAGLTQTASVPEAPAPNASQASPDPGGAAPPNSPATARVVYTRTLQGSVPEFLAVSVSADGSGSYEGHSLKDKQPPRALKLSEATTRQIFALAADLNDFRVPLESHKRVADLGRKTFTYEQGAEKHEVEFNYTTKQTARDLTDLFERVAGVEEHLDTLQYALKYDPLSLPQELLHIQIDLEHKALADPQLMVPQLEQIANNPRLLHIAQVRAQDILKTVNGGQ